MAIRERVLRFVETIHFVTESLGLIALQGKIECWEI